MEQNGNQTPKEKPVDRKKFIAAGVLTAMAMAGLSQNTSNQNEDEKSSAKTKEAKLDVLKRPEVLKNDEKETSFDSEKIQFRRNEKTISEFEDIKTTAKKNLQITKDNELFNELSTRFRRIEKNIKTSSFKQFDEYVYLHIEPLLDQAANLLERGIKDRAEFGDTVIKQLSLAIELNQYWDLDEIHHREEQAGFYEIDAFVANTEFIAENLNLINTQNNKQFLQFILNRRFEHAGLNKLNAEYQKAAWVTGLVSAAFGGQTFTGYVEHTFDSIRKSVALHLQDSAFATKWHDFNVQFDLLQLQLSSFNPQIEFSRNKLLGLKRKSQWQNKDSGFRKERTLVARKYMDIKTKSATDEDGILNYGKRLDSLETRFENDFGEAYSRLTKVAQGASLVYGYNEMILPKYEDDPIQFFDNCLIWARHLINWLIRFNRKDQSFILPISIRNLMSKNEWVESCKKGIWNFNISDQFFSDQFHVRLRGLSVFPHGLKNNSLNGIVGANIKAPLKSYCKHLNGDVKDLDQSMLPTCKLGRVGERDFIRAPEVVGTTSLHNASPFGDWMINLYTPYRKFGKDSKDDDPDIDMKDLFIDLHISVRT